VVGSDHRMCKAIHFFAVKEKGVLSGKRVERRESGSPGEFADLENMTAEQLVDFIRKQAEESLH
jgi:hypothetical protein